MGEIEIPREVSETLEEIRLNGKTNMCDFNAVQAPADDREDHEIVVWLEHNREVYAEVLTTWDGDRLG
jgi:hypothetical protein